MTKARASGFRGQRIDGHEQGRPARVREGGDQDIVRFQLGLGHVREDAGPSLDDARGDGETDQGAGGEIGPLVRACDDLPVGREDPRWRAPRKPQARRLLRLRFSTYPLLTIPAVRVQGGPRQQNRSTGPTGRQSGAQG